MNSNLDNNRVRVNHSNESKLDKMRNTLGYQSSEIKFRTLVEATKKIVIFVLKERHICYVNPAAEALTGYKKEELLNELDFYELLKVKKKPEFDLETLQAQEVQILNKNGQKYSLYFSVETIDFDGEKASLITAFDITKQNPKDREIYQSIKSQSRHKLENLSLNFSSSSLLDKVFNFIECHYQEPIGLKEVAEAVGYCPAYLTDLVKRKTGQTVNRWIVQLRMKTACSLLLETEQSIEQIAYSVGYENIGCFYRQFRLNFNMAPQAWRNVNCKM